MYYLLIIIHVMFVMCVRLVSITRDRIETLNNIVRPYNAIGILGLKNACLFPLALFTSYLIETHIYI